MPKPNVVFVLADQWRADAVGYAGNSQVQTPHIDRLAAESINFTHAVAGIPVCCPARACLLTGEYALTHGVFVNDAHLSDDETTIAHAFAAGGYDTAYIGKWHVDGRGRSAYIPPESRKGFDYWKVLECTHTYNDSKYYAGDSDQQLTWEGYDAIAQTADARSYIRNHSQDRPFFLFLSWGPPHAPYDTAPERYRALYRAEDIELRPNVPEWIAPKARQWLAGYYAHCTALDDCVGALVQTLENKASPRTQSSSSHRTTGTCSAPRGRPKSSAPGTNRSVCRFCCAIHASLGATAATTQGFSTQWT